MLKILRARTALRAALVALAGLMAPAEPAHSADFHAIFEARCLRCHGHAGAFARERLRLDNGEVARRDGTPLAPFLTRHAGGLDPDEIALFLKVFARQIASGGFYQERCEICHDRARELARLRLIVREGRLTGRYSGHDMASFLPGHALMSEAEAGRMIEALTAILEGAR